MTINELILFIILVIATAEMGDWYIKKYWDD